MTARDIDHLLSDILPTLFQNHLMPPANPGFGVAAKEAGQNLDGNRAAESCCFGSAGIAALMAVRL